MAQMRLHRFSYGDKRRNKLNTEMNKMSIRRFLVSFVSVVILLTLAVANTLGQKPARRPDLGAKIVVDQPGSVSAAKLRRSRIGIKLPPAPSEASTGNNLEDILIYRASCAFAPPTEKTPTPTTPFRSGSMAATPLGWTSPAMIVSGATSSPTT